MDILNLHISLLYITIDSIIYMVHYGKNINYPNFAKIKIYLEIKAAWNRSIMINFKSK